MAITITPYERNAKKHPQKQLDALAAIVREVGWRQPILINQKGVIVAGHGRWEVYQQNSDLPEPWVVDDNGKLVMGAPATTPLSEEQEMAYRLADNKLSEGEWDMDLVIEELNGLDSSMLSLTGFDEKLILGEFNFQNKELDIEKIEKQAAEHKTKPCPNCGYEF